MTRRRPRADGFTFVELMVVLAILAFAFSYAIIHLDGATGPARLSSAARQVGTTIEFLRGQAIRAERTLEMHIDLDARQWTTVIPARTGESAEARKDQEEVLVTDPVVLPKWIRFHSVQFDATDQQTTGKVVITFYKGGEMSPNGFMLRLSSQEIADRDEGSYSVEVNGLTGEVSYTLGLARFEQVVKGESF